MLRVDNQCLRKVRHTHEGAAIKAAARTPPQPGFVVTPYKCPFCNGWHVGNKKIEPKSGELFGTIDGIERQTAECPIRFRT